MNKNFVACVQIGTFLLTGCTGAESAHTNGRVLKDMRGCAYIANTDFGDAIFLQHSQELSDKTCDFKAGDQK